jgi:hypothetical protein
MIGRQKVMSIRAPDAISLMPSVQRLRRNTAPLKHQFNCAASTQLK